MIKWMPSYDKSSIDSKTNSMPPYANKIFRIMVKYLLAIAVTLAPLSCKEKHTYVWIKTDYGTMKVKLYNDTPKHRDNFIKLVREGFYDSLLFHRVIPNFVIQGGDPQSRNAPFGERLGMGGPGYRIPAEIKHFHFRGAVAAARQADNVNPKKESSGSQFYIVHGRPVTRQELQQIAQAKDLHYTEEDIQRYLQQGGTPHLDGDYTVFGEVVEGLEVIDRIANIPTYCIVVIAPLRNFRIRHCPIMSPPTSNGTITHAMHATTSGTLVMALRVASHIQ